MSVCTPPPPTTKIPAYGHVNTAGTLGSLSLLVLRVLTMARCFCKNQLVLVEPRLKNVALNCSCYYYIRVTVVEKLVFLWVSAIL